MKKLIYFLLIFLSKLLIVSFSLQLIDNCENQLIVPQYYYPYVYQQPVCQECQTGFIVDYDFNSCIDATSLPMAYYSYCQRLDRNRECDEALCTIQIDQNNLFLQENPQQYDPRCAKIDTVNKVCLAPRFPYTLDISQNIIIHNPNSYCKIFDGSICLQNYETFFYLYSQQKYLKLGYFFNSAMIDISVISFDSIKCIKNFYYDQQKNGCLPQKFNCLKNDGKTCLCSDGEAIDFTGSSCQKIQNCQIYGYVGQIKYCMKCKPGFTSNQFESSIQNQCQLAIPIIAPPLKITFSEMPVCNLYQQYNQQSLLILQQFFQNISGQIFQNLTDPIYLHLLSISVQYYSNPIYNQFRPAQSLQCENLPPQTPSVKYCSTYLAGLCIQCSSYAPYYLQVNNTLQSFSADYQSFCNYPPISYCKVISIDNKCLVCYQNYILKNGQCESANNCYHFNSNGQCLICWYGQLLNNQMSCVDVPTNCLQYYLSSDGNYQCQQCQQNYFLYNYNNIQSCQIDTNYYACISQSSNYCYQCQKGSYLQNSYCQYGIVQYFCSNFDNAKNICIDCQQNYKLINGICQYTSQKSSCYQYYANITLQTPPPNNPNNQYKYACSYKSSLNQCHYKNQNGFYLDQNFQKQKCQLSNQTTYCNRCFQSSCLDTQDSCLKGMSWSQLQKACLPQCLNDQLLINQDYQICNYGPLCDIKFYPSLRVYQCSDCSVVQQLQDCIQQQTLCSNLQVYSQLKNACMEYCGEGKLALDQQSCQTTTVCQDGLTWSNYYKKCVYLNCQNKMAAIDQACSKSTITLTQYYVNNNSTSPSNNYTNSSSDSQQQNNNTSNNNNQGNNTGGNQNSSASSSNNQTNSNSTQSTNSSSSINQIDASQKNQSISNNNSTSGNFTTNNTQETNQSSSLNEFIVQIILLSLIFIFLIIYVIWMKSNQNQQNEKFQIIVSSIKNMLEKKGNKVKYVNIQPSLNYKKIQSNEVEEEQKKQDSEKPHNITLDQLQNKNFQLQQLHHSQQSENVKEDQQKADQVRIDLK
ncbi:hypothetical protein ABPG74_000226 [Tetrahymena malaccensis]